jgi:serine/threonine protein kinase
MSLTALAKVRRDFLAGVVSASEFDISVQIGSSNLGKVNCAVRRATGEIVAFRKLSTDDSLAQDQIDDYFREIRVLWNSHFSFVLSLYGFTIHPPYALITPFVEGGSL